MPREAAQPERKFDTFAEFYAFYLDEHSNRTSRRLHFAGLALALAFIAATIATSDPLWILYAIAAGYGLAWIGHFFFEKNRPASFRQPLYSFLADWKMFWDMMTGRIPL